MKPAARGLRILHAAGPGDVVDSYRHWKDGREMLSETSRTFSGQFFEFCRRTGHLYWAVSYRAPAYRISDGAVIVENRPKPRGLRGLAYHIAQLRYAISLAVSAIRWRAGAVLVDSGTTHWIFLAPLKLLGVKIVGNFHNVLWPKGYRPTKLSKRLLLAADGWFWRHVADAAITVSPECERQIRDVAPAFKGPIEQHCAQFDRRDFAAVPSPQLPDDRPLRVLFAGRVDRNKGVFDIVEMARILEREMPGRVVFDICGGGPKLAEVSSCVEAAGLEAIVRVHGPLQRQALVQMYASSHLVIVPTRSDFCEGMPKVCAEAILCRRPVLTSVLSNAGDVLSGAIILAKPDDVSSYVDCIKALLDDRCAYEHLVNGCLSAQEQFFDETKGFAAALERIFARLEGVSDWNEVDAAA